MEEQFNKVSTLTIETSSATITISHLIRPMGLILVDFRSLIQFNKWQKAGGRLGLASRRALLQAAHCWSKPTD